MPSAPPSGVYEKAKLLVGIAGFAGSGKDTVADMLSAHYGFQKVSLADPLKRICKEVFGFSDVSLWGPSSYRNDPAPGWAGLTPRQALQQLGTEWGRGCHPDVWVRAGIRTAREILDTGAGYTAKFGVDRESILYFPKVEGVAFADVRFRNEIEAIQGAGGYVVRVHRRGSGLSGEAGLHASERELASIPSGCFAAELENDGTLDELRASVRELVWTLRGMARR